MKKMSLFLVLFLWGAFTVTAQYSACQFLRENTGARSIALTGAYVAHNDRADVVFANPAGVSSRYLFSSLHTLPQYDDEAIMTTALSYSHPMPSLNGIMSVSMYYESYGEAIETNQYNEDVSRFSLYDLSMGVSYTTLLNEKISVGVTVKYVYSHYFTINTGNAFAFDFGGLLTTNPSLIHSDELRIGAVLQNFGTKITYQDQDQSDPLPRMMRIGFSYTIPLYSRTKTLLSSEIRKELGTSIANYEYATGLELDYDGTFFARAGLCYEEYSKETTINWGFGLRKFGVTLDYARKEMADMSLHANIFSIGYLF